MKDDDTRREVERLVSMGYVIPENPTPREMLAARMIDPHAWAAHAQEHVDWCKKHNLLSSPTHFGASVMKDRHLALLQAKEMLRHLDRHATGKPDLERFDARAASKVLEAEWWEITYANNAKHGSQRIHITKKAVDAVFQMHRFDGIPSPQSKLENDGSVTLTWSEDDRTACIRIDQDGQSTMTIGEDYAAAIDLNVWQSPSHDPLVLAMTDWVHFEGPHPGDLLTEIYKAA